MIVVTGAAGFIGSRIIRGLNQRGHTDIIAVDDLTQGEKFRNLTDCQIVDYMDKDQFLDGIVEGDFGDSIDAIFHQGACAVTTEWDGRYMLENNYQYSKLVLHYCIEQQIPLYYASSAAIYGLNKTCKEQPEFEKPLNVYGYSKLLFDNYVRQVLPHAEIPIVGLRYFNVYGANEVHKGPMVSVVQHFYNQLLKNETVDIFSNCANCGPGEQRRDFISVDDVVAVNMWLFEQDKHRGIYNCGTGNAITFNELAQTLINWYGAGEIIYTPIPEKLSAAYQTHTEADLTLLRELGYDAPFKTVAEAIQQYLPQKQAEMAVC